MRNSYLGDSFEVHGGGKEWREAARVFEKLMKQKTKENKENWRTVDGMQVLREGEIKDKDKN